jgi:BolA protein
MAIKDEIEARLGAAFSVTELQVVNDFAVKLRAPELAALGRLARHRAVQAALGDINTRVHALALDIG